MTKKPKLGKSADSIFNKTAPGPEANDKFGPVEYRDPAELIPNPDNMFPPLPPEQYQAVKDDIEKNTIHDPLLIRSEDDPVILSGENRHTIALELKLPAVPVRYLKEPMVPEDELKFMLRDNIHRRQLTGQAMENYLLQLYGKDFFLQDHRGGPRTTDQSPLEKGGRGVVPDPLPNKDRAETIHKETGIKKSTASKHIANISKKLKERGATLPQLTKPAPPGMHLARVKGLANEMEKEAAKSPERVGEVIDVVQELLDKLKALNKN